MRLFKKTFMVLALAAAFSMVLPAVGTSAETAAASTNVYYTDSGIVDGYHRLVINTGSGNITTAVNKAALAAKSGATDSVKYMIVIPSGSYTISKAIYLYSNTYLYADGAYVKRPGGGPMLRNGTTKSGGGYSGDRNITIDGGTWNGDAKHAKKNFSIAKFAHGKNFVLKNLTLTNDAGAHHVEFGGINGIRITNCRFTNLYRLKGKKSTVGQEAVQFDITNKTGFVGYTPYDDTVCRNIYVKGNVFKNVWRGIGSHNASYGSYYTNVKIYNNTFTDIDTYAIMAVNMKKVSIKNNWISNAGAGIDFKYYNPGRIKKSKYVKGSRNSKAYLTISGNKISIVKKKMGGNRKFAIRIYGAYQGRKSYGMPKANYCVKNVSIYKNKIKSKYSGILLTDTKNSKITRNTINLRPSRKKRYSSSCITLNAGSKKNRISRNKCYYSNRYGVETTVPKKSNKVYKNRIKKCRKGKTGFSK